MTFPGFPWPTNPGSQKSNETGASMVSCGLSAAALCSRAHQDLVGVSESRLQGQRQVAHVGRDELGLRDDGRSLLQTLLPDLPVLIPNFGQQITGDLVTETGGKPKTIGTMLGGDVQRVGHLDRNSVEWRKASRPIEYNVTQHCLCSNVQSKYVMFKCSNSDVSWRCLSINW